MRRLIIPILVLGLTGLLFAQFASIQIATPAESAEARQLFTARDLAERNVMEAQLNVLRFAKRLANAHHLKGDDIHVEFNADFSAFSWRLIPPVF